MRILWDPYHRVVNIKSVLGMGSESLSYEFLQVFLLLSSESLSCISCVFSIGLLLFVSPQRRQGRTVRS